VILNKLDEYEINWTINMYNGLAHQLGKDTDESIKKPKQQINLEKKLVCAQTMLEFRR